MTEVLPVVDLPPIPMTIREGRPRVTSRDVADIFGKRHDDVLRRIRQLECSEPFNLRNFAEISFIDARNRPQPMVEMTRDGFTFLAMGFTGPRAAHFKEAFIAAFNSMEAQLHGGAALPELARSVSALVQRQEAMETKVNAILDLVDVTKRYVTLLESNQKKKPRTTPYARVTSELVARVQEMVAQGYSISAIALEVDLPRTTIYRIRAGEYSSAVRMRNDKAAVQAGEEPR